MIPLPQAPKLVEKKGNKATFEIGGLYPRYGITMGNTLRRVLLSSLEGAAITRVKIKGVQHEFSIIPGLLEDVLHIILNLKQVRCRVYSDEPVKMDILAKGEREVTAGDFKAPSQIEIINKDAPIAVLTAKNANLEMECWVEKGVGYVSSEQLKKEKLSIGTLVIDAIFTPVKRVSFRVENMRVGERTDFDRLFLEIETDGTISPETALNQASEILLRQFQCIQSVLPKPKKAPGQPKAVPKKTKRIDGRIQEDAAKKSVEDLNLSTRTVNALLSNNIKTVGGLLKRNEVSIAELDGIGDAGMKEIKKSLKKIGLELK